MYCLGASLSTITSISISDLDDSSIDAVYIQIYSGYVNGQDTLLLNGIHPSILSSWNVTEGKLIL